jgi:hypothetical protein
MTVSESEFYQQNQLMIEDIAKDIGKLEAGITQELYNIYLVSIKDRDND